MTAAVSLSLTVQFQLTGSKEAMQVYDPSSTIKQPVRPLKEGATTAPRGGGMDERTSSANALTSWPPPTIQIWQLRTATASDGAQRELAEVWTGLSPPGTLGYSSSVYRNSSKNKHAMAQPRPSSEIGYVMRRQSMATEIQVWQVATTEAMMQHRVHRTVIRY